MTAPLPYPVGSSATPVVTDAFTGWPSDPDWVATGDAIVVDHWAGTNSILAQAAQLFYWGNNPATEQEPFLRSSALTKVYTGLTPSTFYTVLVSTSWKHGPGFGFVGMRVNGAPYSPSVGPSGTLTAPSVDMVGYGTSTAGGELTIAFALENLHPSYTLDIAFDNLRLIEGFVDDPFRDIIINTAVLYHDNNIPISITRGGARFDPGWRFKERGFPGKRANAMGGHVLAGMQPVIRTTMLLTGERQFLVYAPGGAWSDGPYGRRYTPPALGAAIPAGAHLSNVRCIWERLRGDYLQVHYPKGIVRTHGIETTDLTEGGLPVEIEAVQDLTSGTPSANRLYYVDILPAGYAL